MAQQEDSKPAGLKVYAHSVSQPSRALLWALRINNTPFEFIKTDPLAGATRTPEFLALNPSHTIPTIKDHNGVLFESAAILCYLADEHQWDKWYPKAHQTRARIHQYLSWHHSKTRQATMSLVRPMFLAAFMGKTAPTPEELDQTVQEFSKDVVAILELWLKSSKFLATDDHPSIADLMCYSELDQLETFGVFDFSKFPEVARWMNAMKELPFHDEVRQELSALAQLVANKLSKL